MNQSVSPLGRYALAPDFQHDLKQMLLQVKLAPSTRQKPKSRPVWGKKKKPASKLALQARTENLSPNRSKRIPLSCVIDLTKSKTEAKDASLGQRRFDFKSRLQPISEDGEFSHSEPSRQGSESHQVFKA